MGIGHGDDNETTHKDISMTAATMQGTKVMVEA